MATIIKRTSAFGEVSWQVKVRRKGYPIQTYTSASCGAAEAWGRQVENEMDRGIFVCRKEAESTTLHTALGRYEKEVSKLKKGHEQERYRITAWQDHKLAKRTLASLRATDFAEYRDDRLAAGASAATIRNDLAVISHLFSTCTKEWGIPVENPIANMRLPRANNARDRRLLHGEEERILSAFDAAARTGAGIRENTWIKPAFILAVETAMRQGELLGLRWENVDLKRRVARLPDTKNGTPRDVPLSSRAVTVLEGLPKAIKGEVIMTTPSALDQSFRRCVARARRVYVKECLAEGVPEAQLDDDPMLLNLTWHDLRHEATSRLADKLAMHELMKVTGHKDTRMLARYYHPRAEDLARKLG